MLTRAKTVRCWLVVLGVCVLGACGGDSDSSSDSTPSGGAAQSAGATTGGSAGAAVGADTGTDAQAGPTTLPGTEADWAIVEEKARWAVEC